VRTAVRGAGTLLLNVIPFGLQAVRAGTGDRIVQFEKTREKGIQSMQFSSFFFFNQPLSSSLPFFPSSLSLELV
jgi:hypothetical protein